MKIRSLLIIVCLSIASLASLTSIVFLIGCDKIDTSSIVSQPQHTKYYSTNSNGAIYWLYNVTVIDGCQYIESNVHIFAHKGNCTNHIHIYNR